MNCQSTLQLLCSKSSHPSSGLPWWHSTCSKCRPWTRTRPEHSFWVRSLLMLRWWHDGQHFCFLTNNRQILTNSDTAPTSNFMHIQYIIWNCPGHLLPTWPIIIDSFITQILKFGRGGYHSFCLSLHNKAWPCYGKVQLPCSQSYIKWQCKLQNRSRYNFNKILFCCASLKMWQYVRTRVLLCVISLKGWSVPFPCSAPRSSTSIAAAPPPSTLPAFSLSINTAYTFCTKAHT